MQTSRAYIQNRRLTRDEVRKLCATCNETFVDSTANPYPSRTCTTCLDAIEIVTDAKIDVQLSDATREPGSGFDWLIRILARMRDQQARYIPPSVVAENAALALIKTAKDEAVFEFTTSPEWGSAYSKLTRIERYIRGIA